jgi:two-component system cell cycle sensor histidine kinase/response regulator CckA
VRRLIGTDIELVTDLRRALPPVLADPDDLRQVLLNLADNAREAMPSGGRLEISCGLAAEPPATSDLPAPRTAATEPGAGPYVTLRVRDSGAGMTEAVRLRLFEPFFTTKARGRGTGLGLATVHGVVTRAAGLVTVDSAAGAGSTFTVYLPAVERTAPGPAARTPAAGHGDPDAAARVLLVENEGMVRELYRSVLQEVGYQVVAAESGEAALALAEGRDAPFDLLITDVIMAGMSGYALIAAMLARQPGLRTVIISGYPAGDMPEGSVPDRFLAKPLRVSTLLQEMRDLLDGGPSEPGRPGSRAAAASVPGRGALRADAGPAHDAGRVP